MTSDFGTRLNAVDQRTLTPLVRKALKNESAEVIDWSYPPLSGGWSPLTIGIYRFKGDGRISEQTVPWSLILKAAGKIPEASCDIPAHWSYWKREILAYQSGILDDLPGDLVAPCCYGVFEYPGEEFWIWLEDVQEEQELWSLERYGLATRHLGQFNGAYLVNRSIPDEVWLSSGRMLGWLDLGEPTIRNLRNWSKLPLVQSLYRDNLERNLRLWAERDRLLKTMSHLPQTFCHHDANQANLMVRKDEDGHAQTVAIDWALAGRGSIGQEISSTVFRALYTGISASQAKELVATIFEGYLAGLRDAGWHGDARLVRFGYTATVALAWGVGLPSIFIGQQLNDKGQLREKAPSYPTDFIDQMALLQNHLLDLGDEACRLLNTLQLA